MEALKWVFGSVIWKFTWAMAVISACIRGVVESVIRMLMLPWRIWKAFVHLINYVKTRLYKMFVYESQDNKIAQSLLDSIGEEGNEDATKKNTTEVEAYIGISTSSTAEIDEDGEAVTVPRGGASNTARSSFRKKHLTMRGHEIPPFHRRKNIEYSNDISERVGVCISMRVSEERGFEYRWNFFYSCLPTLEFWGRRIGIGDKTKNIAEQSTSNKTHLVEGDKIKGTGSSASSPKKHSKLQSFLDDHTASLGCSGGWPLPVDPHFSCNLLLSLNRFYYAWLLKNISSILLPSSKPSSNGKKAASTNSQLTQETAAATKKLSSKHSSRLESSSEDAISNDSKRDGSASKAVTFVCDADSSDSEQDEQMMKSKVDSEGHADKATKVVIKRKAT